MKVNILVRLFLLLMSIWSAHLAGAIYVRAGRDRRLKAAAVARSAVSIGAGLLALAI